jgi:hypothetical protein
MPTIAADKWSGLFWLASQPNEKRAGSLSVSTRGAMELELIGAFDGPDTNVNDLPTKKRLLGITSDGKYLTLIDCYRKTFNSSFNEGLGSEKYRVNFLLEGCHFQQDEKILFERIDFTSRAIHCWLAFSKIKTTYENGAVSLTLDRMPPESWILAGGTALSIYSSWSVNPGSGATDSSISQKTWLSLDLKSKKTLAELLTEAGKIKNFVSLAINQTATIEEVRLFTPELTIENAPGGKLAPISLYYATTAQLEPDLDEISDPYLVIKFMEIKGRFSEIMSIWHAAHDNLSDCLNLYFSATSSTGLFLENKFLMLAQSLEALHRHSSDKRCMSESEYTSLCSQLREACPKEHGDWLEPKLKFGNEISLRARLKDQLQGLDVIFCAIKPKELITRIVNTRNFLTHYDASTKESASRGAQLFGLNSAMEILFCCQMLKIIGFSNEEIVSLAKSSESMKARIRGLIHITQKTDHEV